MSLRIGDIAPDFEADTSQGNISFHAWIGDADPAMYEAVVTFVATRNGDEFCALSSPVTSTSVEPGVVRESRGGLRGGSRCEKPEEFARK